MLEEKHQKDEKQNLYKVSPLLIYDGLNVNDDRELDCEEDDGTNKWRISRSKYEREGIEES